MLTRFIYILFIVQAATSSEENAREKDLLLGAENDELFTGADPNLKITKLLESNEDKELSFDDFIRIFAHII